MLEPDIWVQLREKRPEPEPKPRCDSMRKKNTEMNPIHPKWQLLGGGGGDVNTEVCSWMVVTETNGGWGSGWGGMKLLSLRCVLRSWKQPYGPQGGAGARWAAGGGGARGGGAPRSRSTGGGAGGGARCWPLWEESLPVDDQHQRSLPTVRLRVCSD